MSIVTTHDNGSHCLREAEYPYATDTMLSFAQRTMGASTRTEQPGYTQLSRVSSVAPTVRWSRSATEAGNDDGSPFDRYRVIKRLCIGAEAQLFVAERSYDKERVVLKIYHEGISPEPGVLERISLNSGDHVVKVYEHGRIGTEGTGYEVQEYVSDTTLSHVIGSFPIDFINCRLILHQMAEALAHIHMPDIEGRFLIHRDIKPSNVLIRTDASSLDLVLCDFGISSITGEEVIAGPVRRDCTPPYTAPEIFSGKISPKVDYWSLGIILLEAIQGCNPLENVSANSIEHLLHDGWRPDISAVKSHEWQQLIAGLTHPSPEERWGHAEVAQWLNIDSFSNLVPAKTEQLYIDGFEYLRAASIQEFAGQLVRNWNRVSSILDDKLFRRFLSSAIEKLAPGRTIDEVLDESSESNDVRLLRLIYRLCPSFPHFWKEWTILRPHLMDICRNAATGDIILQQVTVELYELRILKELALITSNKDLEIRADRWHDAMAEYTDIKDSMERCGAPKELFPEHGRAVAMMYLTACEDGSGMALTDADITPMLLFSFPWLQTLKSQTLSLSPAKRLIRSFVLPHCIDWMRDNFLTSHDNITLTHIESQPSFNLGWNPPTIALSAAHTDIDMTICQKKSAVAKGVRLMWDTRGAIIVYMKGFGFIRSTGTIPDERMLHGAVYRFIDKCPCEEHSSNWFTLTETTTFTLTAIGPGGISVHRLPPIVVPQGALEPQIELAVPIPELLPQSELSVPIPELFPQLQLASQQSFTVDSMEADDLLLQLDFTVPALGKDNMLPQVVFSKYSDAQVRYARENRLI